MNYYLTLKREKNLIDDYAFLRRKLEKTKLEDKNNLLYRFTKENIT